MPCADARCQRSERTALARNKRAPSALDIKLNGIDSAQVHVMSSGHIRTIIVDRPGSQQGVVSPERDSRKEMCVAVYIASDHPLSLIR